MLFDFDQDAYDQGRVDAFSDNVDHERWSTDPSYADGVDVVLDEIFLNRLKAEQSD